MSDTCAVAVTPDGRHLAVLDGPELLVYRGDGQPAWKVFADDILVGARFVGTELATVDGAGNVVFYSAPDGRVIERLTIEGRPVGAISSPDGVFAVVTDSGVVQIASNGARGNLPHTDLVLASFGPDRNSMALVDRQGVITAMDPNTGVAWGSLAVGGPIHAVCWCHQGFWMVTSGSAVLRIDGGATQIIGRTELPLAGEELSVSHDGAMAAVRMPPQRVAILELHGHRYIGDIVFRRGVFDVMFGRQALLAIGFDDGDASTVDLLSRDSVRTEPHPGRGRNNWNLDMQFDAAPLRGAVTLLRAGGAPVAERILADEDDYESGGSNFGCQVAILVVFVFILAVTGCSTFLLVLRWFGYV